MELNNEGNGVTTVGNNTFDVCNSEIVPTHDLEIETHIRRNSNWGLKKYLARHPPKRAKPESFAKTGVILLDDCDKNRCNRIVELGYILEWAIQLYSYNIIFVKEEQRRAKGLVGTIVFNCTQCTIIYKFDTENPTRPVSLINSGAVWGTMATGSTYAHLEELLSCMDIPTLPEKMFSNMENDLGQEWKSSLIESMEEAGKEEKNKHF